jgi:hypothetical protein
MEKSLKTKILSIFLLIVFLTNACVPIPSKSSSTATFVLTERLVLTKTKPPENTPTSTVLPTATKTSLPTIEKHPPTPTIARPIEWDIDPFIEKRVNLLWNGVNIKVNLILDSSLHDIIESINIPDLLLAEIAAKTIYGAWYKNTHYMDIIGYEGYEKVVDFGSYEEPEQFEKFLTLWKKAQESGEISDWSRVKLSNIRANNLEDGNGYVQRAYTFWPMYDGDSIEGIVGFDQLSIVLIEGSESDYVSDRLWAEKT